MNKEEHSEQLRPTLRALLNELFAEHRLLVEGIIEIENVFLEQNGTRKEIEYLPIGEVFDKRIQLAKYEIKRFNSKFFSDIISSLSKEVPYAKTFKIDCKKLIKDLRLKYEKMTSKFFIPEKYLDKELFTEKKLLSGSSRYKNLLQFASSIASEININLDDSFMTDKKRSNKKTIHKENSPGEKSFKMDEVVSAKETYTSEEEDEGEEEQEEDVDGGEYASSEEDHENTEKPFKRKGLSLEGLAEPIDIQDKNMHLDQFESGIESGKSKIYLITSWIHPRIHLQKRANYVLETSKIIRVHDQGDQCSFKSY